MKTAFAPGLVSSALAAAAWTGAALSGAHAAVPAEPGTPVVTIVRVPKPWYAPQALVASRMRDTVAQYSAIDGLLFKAYSFERSSGDFGGLYCWGSVAAARAWFNPDWFARVRSERGTEGQVRFFEAPVAVDNTAAGTPAAMRSDAVATLVEIAIPAGVSREAILAGFQKAVPEYQKVPGLLRKQFILSDQGTFGGVYLWKDEASATAWFNADWKARVQKTYGAAARIEWFDTPILLPVRVSSVAKAQP
jgi:heme-degrading monooxygenase HmoA